MVIGDQDADAGLWRARARHVLPGSSRVGDMAPFRSRFAARIHSIDSGLKGNIAVTVVPLPRKLTIFNLAPISSARSRIPIQPTPACLSVNCYPSPSSQSSRRTSFTLFGMTDSDHSSDLSAY